MRWRELPTWRKTTERANGRSPFQWRRIEIIIEGGDPPCSRLMFFRPRADHESLPAACPVTTVLVFFTNTVN
ncbi:hypothetical protein KAS50_09070 [bacterium]|nr:hypothetical protein [bacterium]